MTAGFLLVGWNTYSAIVLAKDTYNGKMEWSKPLGYSIAGLAGLTAGLLFFYGLKATEHPELLDAEGDGEIYYEGGRMVSIEENTTVNYSWRTSPDDIEVDEWDIGSQVEERVQQEMYDGDGGSGYWTYRNYDDKEIAVEYEWDKIVDEGEEEEIKSWAETDESFSAEGRAYPHQVFNSTSKAHAEKVAHLVPQSVVQKYDAPFGWKVMSKTPYQEARGYFLPWLRENDYFRTNQFLSEVQYEAEGREETQRMTRAEAEALADKVVKLVTPYVDRVEVCGSYRRGSPRPGDLDVVIIPKKGVTLPEIVKAIKPAEVHWMGEKKAQVLIDDHNVDFRTSSPKGWGAALLYFTGPAGYNIGMRVRAKKMGMKLNEYGIFDRNTNAYLGGATEDEIYTVLGKTVKLPAMRAESVMDSCSHCGAKGDLVEIPTRLGHKKTFCGPICLYKWEDRTRLAAEEVFEAPRAAFSNPAQAEWEKTYNIRAKKPLTKFLKQRMGGKKPSDDDRTYTYSGPPTAQGVTKDEAKLIQGYATVMKMCEFRFMATNAYMDEPSYKAATNAHKAYGTSWNPKYNQRRGAYLQQAVTDLHALAALDNKGKTAYMAAEAEDFKEKRLPFMREFLRYYDITMIGPYKDIRMVATDRAPYSTHGGYGNVHYRRRNPYTFGQDKLVKDIFAYNSTKETLTIGNRESEAALFTRMTKMRPYRYCPRISNDILASVEYETHGGHGWKGTGSQSFTLTPVILKKPGSRGQRNPNPGYSSRSMEGWRWDVEDWETRTSAPYRYATMVSIPNGEDLQRIYTGGEAIAGVAIASSLGTQQHSAQGGKALHRNQIVDTINACTPLLKVALKEQADTRAKREIKEEKEYALKSRNQALTNLEEITEMMITTLKSRVTDARSQGVSEDDIYMTLELTQYDLEQLVNDWEPADYMAEG